MDVISRRDSAHIESPFVDQLRAIVGSRHVLTTSESTRRYRTGFRFGSGPALAVVRPGTLVEQWRILKACAAANKIIIMQAANTGLTGGSTPYGGDYDREIVIVNTMRIARIRLIAQGRQVICYPGSTLYQLENALKPLGRVPHSVIGSSCIGASVTGGLCNNSGGSLIHRGPSYTQLALFARIDESGEAQLINHLGIKLGDSPEAILGNLDHDTFTDEDIEHSTDRLASDHDYAEHVRDISADSPSRFNSDPRRLFEASGSAGKVMIFAVRFDTFPAEPSTKVFYIGTNDPAELTHIRRHILTNFKALPIEGEYIHRAAFDIAEKYGKDTFLAIRYLGTRWLPKLLALKECVDALGARMPFLPRDFGDKLLQIAGGLFPNHLPKRIRTHRDNYEHHLMLKMSGPGIVEARHFLTSTFPSKTGAFFECTDDEGKKAFLHRFATAGAAVRYRSIHRREVEDILAIDMALRRNDRNWFETLPEEISKHIVHKLYYGHFFCYVFHQDYIVRKDHDILDLEHRMLQLLDARGAQYPAEHNVGHLYKARPTLAHHYQNLDPCNCFNPGVGRTAKNAHWREH